MLEQWLHIALRRGRNNNVRLVWPSPKRSHHCIGTVRAVPTHGGKQSYHWLVRKNCGALENGSSAPNTLPEFPLAEKLRC
jgi:hypothetical protein